MTAKRKVRPQGPERWQTKAFVCHQKITESVREEVANELLRVPLALGGPAPRAMDGMGGTRRPSFATSLREPRARSLGPGSAACGGLRLPLPSGGARAQSANSRSGACAASIFCFGPYVPEMWVTLHEKVLEIQFVHFVIVDLPDGL